MTNQPKTWTKDQCQPALAITRDELIAFGVPADAIDAGEMRGHLVSVGPWQIARTYTALCMSAVWTPEDKREFSSQRESKTVYGMRTLSACRSSGYQLEGRVSVNGRNGRNGRKVRGFTSSQLFELPDGKLINVATIHACLND